MMGIGWVWAPFSAHLKCGSCWGEIWGAAWGRGASYLERPVRGPPSACSAVLASLASLSQISCLTFPSLVLTGPKRGVLSAWEGG